jgi:LAS superfamily LD-carboxypeptidase LdcB
VGASALARNRDWPENNATPKRMRPDVAAAYDRMSAAAKRVGIDLVVVSGFRSDAEHAELCAGQKRRAPARDTVRGSCRRESPLS